MQHMLKRPYSWMTLFAALFLVLGAAQFAACGSDDDDDTSPVGDDDTSPAGDDDTSTQATPTPESATPTPESAATPTPAPQKVSVTFTVDVNIDADGDPATNLNEVKEGEQVFVVGDFCGWNPNDPAYALTDNGDGTYTGTFEFTVGSTILFKFAKTTSNPDDAWAEGEKNFMSDQEADYPGCTLQIDDGTPQDFAMGLFEVPNRELTIPDTDYDVGAIEIDAWRDTAESYGLHSCD